MLQSDWETPSFAKSRKRTPKDFPYLETELCENNHLLHIINYELYKKMTALAVLWDLNATNHEVTL